MLSLPAILWHEATTQLRPPRQPEPAGTMDDAEQVRSYVQAYEWGGPTSALQLHHLRELSSLIRPGDTVLDLACGPGPLLLELAPLYRDTTFIGADLSGTMLEHLQQEASSRPLDNVSVLKEDICTLPSLHAGSIDLVISTSALHHLRDESGLATVFQRMRSLLTPGGGFYLFDFGLLKSTRARQIFVAEVAKLAPPLTARDYELSLQAAFPIEEVRSRAEEELPRPYEFSASAFVDFFYGLRTPARAVCPDTAYTYINDRWRSLSTSMKAEYLMLRWLRRRKDVL